MRGEPEVQQQHHQQTMLKEMEQAGPQEGDPTTPPSVSDRHGRDERESMRYLDKGQVHMVWKPDRRRAVRRAVDTRDILERRKRLQKRVWATKLVLKVQREMSATDLNATSEEPHQRQNSVQNDPVSTPWGLPFHDLISQCEDAADQCSIDDDGFYDQETRASSGRAAARASLRDWMRQQPSTMSIQVSPQN